MPNKKIIYQYLRKFREYLGKLKTLKKYSFEEFEKNIEVNWAINRGLQLIIECSIDLGEEIITGLNFNKPNTYKETFRILLRQGIISLSLSKEMQRLANFRNRLVHDYLFLDEKEIYQVFQKDLKYFEKYLLTIEKFIKRKKK